MDCVQGAGVGLLCSLSFSFWIGIGAIVDGPRRTLLPLTSINCSRNATPILMSFVTYNITTTSLTTLNTTFTTQEATLLSDMTSSLNENPGWVWYHLIVRAVLHLIIQDGWSIYNVTVLCGLLENALFVWVLQTSGNSQNGGAEWTEVS